MGPRYVKRTRFYSLNTVDVATARAGVQPIKSRATEDVIPAFWALWTRLGIPDTLQLDNELVFFGNRRYPRATGQLLRLCMQLGVEVLFIPIREPWRNGLVEKFNDHWNKKFYRRETMGSFDELRAGSLSFEHRHNSRWRYSKLQGRTPAQALAASSMVPRFPHQPTPPSMPFAKPTQGRVHFIRLIRSDAFLEIFGQRFQLPPEAIYEYVRATVDIATQRLTVSLQNQTIERFPYSLS